MKNQYRGGIAQKGGLEQFADLKGGLDKKEGVVFLGEGLIPQCTLWGAKKLGVMKGEIHNLNKFRAGLYSKKGICSKI